MYSVIFSQKNKPEELIQNKVATERVLTLVCTVITVIDNDLDKIHVHYTMCSSKALFTQIRFCDLGSKMHDKQF